jgi:TonB family protein
MGYGMRGRLVGLGIVLLVLASCNSNQPRTPRSADADKATSHGRIMAGHLLTPKNCGEMLKYVRPAYPKEARKSRAHGVVRFRVLVTKSGELRELEVISGDDVFVPAALAAVKQWRYGPCRLNGDLIEYRVAIDVPFTPNQ